MKLLILLVFFQIGLFQEAIGQQNYNLGAGQQNYNVGAGQQNYNLGGLSVPWQIWTQCRNENPVDNNNLNRFYTRNFSNRDMSFNCFTRCIMERMGLIRNDDLFEENARLLLRNPEVRNCANLQGTQGLDRCERAFQIYQCLQQINGNGGSVLTFSELP